jgi:signal transduction histidine kinase
MPGRPSLRRRLIMSYLVVVLAVTSAAFVTVQVLVPRFFEQAVQQRLGPGPQNDNTGTSSPGQGQGGPGNRGTTSTTTAAPDDATTRPQTESTNAPAPTGSTIGPTGSTNGSGPGTSSGSQNGDGQGNRDRGSGTGNSSVTTTSIESYSPIVPGIVAAGVLAQETELNPIPIDIQQDYDRALTAALWVALGIGLLIALALGSWLTRRLLRTFTGIKEGASMLADGHYSVRVPVPAEVELADLAESVNTLADSLQRTEQTRARLVSDLAHEIRNPLSTIEGYMEGLIDGVLPASRETYEAVASEAHRLKRLTWDLSTLSKAQEGAIELDTATHDLRTIVAGVADTLRPQYEINDVELTITLESPMPVHVDDDRIAQTLTNLLGNALSHTPPGGKVTVTGNTDDRWCHVSVVDTGPGIPEGELETIFERFTRLDSTHSGTGIGLNIARTLARSHGGDITASPARNHSGARFDLKLPRSR